MKINFKKTQGNVLFGTLFTTGIICLYLGSYLSLVSSENRITTRSQTWNMAIPVAEAGVEEAMSHLKATYPTPNNSHGWEYTNGTTILIKTQKLSDDEKYTVGIIVPKTPNDTPVIISEGFARPPAQTDFVSRTIKVHTQRDGNEIPGLVVVTTAVMNGNKLVVDSFNSTNSAFSTPDGRYDPLKRGDKALLATLSRTVGAVDLSNMDVWGKVASGYNGGPPKTGPQSTVGDKAWHAANMKGIQPGHYTDDVNLTFEPPSAPYTSGLKPTTIDNTTILTGGLNGSDFVNYSADNLSGNVYVVGKVRLLVTKTFDVSSLTVSNSTGTAKLELYVAAPSVNLSGGKLNVQGRASNFKYYGLPGNQSLSVGGNGEMSGIFNAPQTVMTFSGGGRGSQDFSGAALCKSVVMRGTYSFHFDEAIGQEMVDQYTASTWDEIPEDWISILSGKVSLADVLDNNTTYVLSF